jgi:hypothetical protein
MGMQQGVALPRIERTVGDGYFWRTYWPDYPWESIFDDWGHLHEIVKAEGVAWSRWR